MRRTAQRVTLVVVATLLSGTVLGAASASTPPTPDASCTVVGTSGRDVLRGTPGDDVICGLGGRDRLLGLGGRDILRGGTGADVLLGGPGDDALDGGPGADTGSGGRGDDVCTPDTGLSDCTIDGDAPVLRDVVVPAQVQAGGRLVVSWAALDASGVLGYASVGGRNGWAPWCFAANVTREEPSGDRLAFECTVPDVVPNGEYAVFIGSVDDLGNRAETHVDFQVVGGSDDVDAPRIVSGPDLPDVAPGDTFTLRWELSDASGVSYTEAWVYTPEGSLIGYDQKPGSTTSAAVLVAGDATDGIWEQTFTVSPDASLGSYLVTLSVRDSVGNRDVPIIGRITVRP
ncbi:MAG: calcium-binding protein [bacterium]